MKVSKGYRVNVTPDVGTSFDTNVSWRSVNVKNKNTCKNTIVEHDPTLNTLHQAAVIHVTNF